MSPGLERGQTVSGHQCKEQGVLTARYRCRMECSGDIPHALVKGHGDRQTLFRKRDDAVGASRGDPDREVLIPLMQAILPLHPLKRGVQEPVRRLLGYHASGRQQCVDLYARDTWSHPMRILGSVLHEIRVGLFRPDNSHSQRYEEGYHPFGAFTAEMPLPAEGTKHKLKEEKSQPEQSGTQV